MSTRRVFGIAVLGLAVIFMGPMVLMAGMNVDRGAADGSSVWALMLVFLVPGSVLILVGVLLVGGRFRADAVGWPLIAAGLYGLLVFFMMYTFAGSPEAAEMTRTMDPRNPEIFDPDAMSPLRALSVAAVLILAGLPFAGWRFRDRLPGAGGRAVYDGRAVQGSTAVDAGKAAYDGRAVQGSTAVQVGTAVHGDPISDGGRPLSVTLVAWLLIATNALGVLSWLYIGIGPRAADLEKVAQLWGIPLGLQVAWALVGNAILILSGIYLLQGRSWARWTAAGYMALNLVASLALFSSSIMLLPAVLWLAVLVVFLFVRRPASDFFTAVPRR